MRAWLPLLFLLAGGAVPMAEAQFFGGRGLGIFGGGLGRSTFDSRGVASNGFCGECTTFKACFLCGRSLYVFRIRCRLDT